MNEKWEYIKERIEYWCMKKIKFSDNNYIEFRDGTYFSREMLEERYNFFSEAKTTVETYIKENNLDMSKIDDYSKVLTQFKDYNETFSYNLKTWNFDEYLQFHIKEMCNKLVIEYFNKRN